MTPVYQFLTVQEVREYLESDVEDNDVDCYILANPLLTPAFNEAEYYQISKEVLLSFFAYSNPSESTRAFKDGSNDLILQF